MMIKHEVLAAIQRGEIDLQFRRWSRPTVKPGGTLKTKVGLMQIGRVDEMRPEDVTEKDAKRAGMAVHDRAGQPCPACAGEVRTIRQSGRSTFYCPRCQR